jgi:hypothetical protein
VKAPESGSKTSKHQSVTFDEMHQSIQSQTINDHHKSTKQRAVIIVCYPCHFAIQFIGSIILTIAI